MNIFNKNCYHLHINSYISEIESGDLKNLQPLFCVLTKKSAKHKKIAAHALCRILENSPEKDIYRIDELMRRAPSYYTSRRMCTGLNIKDFITWDMTEAERRAVLVFSSFNSSGFIREQAVKALEGYSNTLPFIIMRINDWVKEVRDTAKKVLIKIFDNVSDSEFLKSIPFAEKLKRSERTNNSDILSMFSRKLSNDENLLYKALSCKDSRLKNFCISLLEIELNTSDAISHLLYRQLKIQNDPFIRRNIYFLLLKTNFDANALGRQFLYDKHPKNRMISLQFFISNKSANIFDIVKILLIDKTHQVRTYARAAMHDINSTFDFESFYMSQLYDHTTAAIYGLGEIGTPNDIKLCGIIEKYLFDTDSDVQTRKAAITALMKIAPNRYLNTVTEMLISDIPGVVKTAAIVLSNQTGIDYEKVLEICLSAKNIYNKLKCASLLFTASKWDSLIYILTLIDSEYSELANMANNRYESWYLTYNKSFIPPKPRQMQRIKILSEKLSRTEQKKLEYFIK